ncbi:cytidylate kinase family protein [Candidatus Woesearchaeota archaeon]|nr:cytidylate kinase family protein [Candidatus Woesearchaeota archaeon]MBI2660798.1 cytidylate kinase family protein [Candidatus Woesearchaeota archaeon]
MIITISGKAGSGKSTVAKVLASKLGLKHYSIGDIMREMAVKRGLSLLELNKKAETDKSIDDELDSKLKKLGNEGRNFVIDGRLTAFFIPNADVKIFLDADENVRAARIIKDKRALEKDQDVKQMLVNIELRESSEKKRYKQYYGVDYHDKSLYDNVIDTTDLSAEQVVKEILGIVERKKSGRNSPF